MKNILMITSGILIVVFGFIYFLKPTEFKNEFNNITSYVIGSDKKLEVKQKIKKHSFWIVDGSGSKKWYAVPKVDIEDLSNYIDKVKVKGGGDLWITYVDKNAFDNHIEYINILDIPSRPESPQREPGELDFNYKPRLDAYNKVLKSFIDDSSKTVQNFEKIKRDFLNKVSVLLSEAYRKKNKDEDYSDIHGSINSATRALLTILNDSVNKKFILLISDCQDDIHKVLEPIHNEVSVIVVNPNGPTNEFERCSVKFDNLDRALEHVLNY